MWGNRKGQPNQSAMKGPHPERTASSITVPPASGKYEMLCAPQQRKNCLTSISVVNVCKRMKLQYSFVSKPVIASLSSSVTSGTQLKSPAKIDPILLNKKRHKESKNFFSVRVVVRCININNLRGLAFKIDFNGHHSTGEICPKIREFSGASWSRRRLRGFFRHGLVACSRGQEGTLSRGFSWRLSKELLGSVGCFRKASLWCCLGCLSIWRIGRCRWCIGFSGRRCFCVQCGFIRGRRGGLSSLCLSPGFRPTWLSWLRAALVDNLLQRGVWTHNGSTTQVVPNI